MTTRRRTNQVEKILKSLEETEFGPLDLLPRGDLVEKLIELDLSGVPAGPAHVTAVLSKLAEGLAESDTSDLKVVVFGGGTGLSNVVGGDSRNPVWPQAPFDGLKDLFPRTVSVVCVTDDGGSTGELMKDLPLVALGDLRHVLLSSVQKRILKFKYGLSSKGALAAAEILHRLFNYRFKKKPVSSASLILQTEADLQELPPSMATGLKNLIDSLFMDPRLKQTLSRPHCLGNLILAAAIYHYVESGFEVAPQALLRGISHLAELIGASPGGILPATSTMATLKFLYANGVLATGEYKSAFAQRGSPVDRVFVEFVRQPAVYPELLTEITGADIIIFAPGSLFSSIIPILQVPGVAEAIRGNEKALKILLTNLWIQRGETDLAHEDPRRRFYVSDLIAAYQRNIPGGVKGLFKQVVALGLHDIPGSVLQRYALEEKVPIYLDRDKVSWMGYLPIECRIFSKMMLAERRVVQHDSWSLARAIRTIWAVRNELPKRANGKLTGCFAMPDLLLQAVPEAPCMRRQRMRERLAGLEISKTFAAKILEILWRHADIPIAHLDYLQGVRQVNISAWSRSQEWDRICSFYGPDDGFINIRSDVQLDSERFEVAFLVALGQSLLGNYVAKKETLPVMEGGELLGKIFQLTLRPPEARNCYLDGSDLDSYLQLARMNRSVADSLCYTRLVNGQEGFTPPGMLFGLAYAWFLDNRFSLHVEYKMKILKSEISDLIPEQVKVCARRRALVDFFREKVFNNTSPLYSEIPETGIAAQG